jgi:hypothetical protein
MASINLYGFARIRDFRVRLPKPLFPYSGKEQIGSRHVSEVPERDSGWLSIDDLDQFFPSHFADRNPMNIPGPIYGAETDTCATGPEQAPQNVLLDTNGQEFVFKQPSTADEFRDIVSAAICECFAGYGADGDTHWRLSLIREWWQTRDQMLRGLHKDIGNECGIAKWREGLLGGLAKYLRIYAFYVENGRVPNEDDALPEL